MEPRSRGAALRDRVRSLPDRHGRVALAILCVICALGFGLRANRALHPLPHPGVDATAYFQLSKSLYTEHHWGSAGMVNENDWSPGAPLLYASVYFLTGGVHDGYARMLVGLLGLASILVCYLLGRRLAGPAAGLLAALGVAIYPPFVHNTGRLLSESPAVFTLSAAVLAFLWADEQPGRRAWLWPGFLFGATALIRPDYLLFGAAFAVIVLFRVGRRSDWRLGARAAALLLAAFLLPVLPWTVRNYIALDRLVPISTGGGKALFVGTYLPADGDYFKVKAKLVERYDHRTVDRPELARINSVPLFDRVAARYPDLPRDSALGRQGRKNFFHYFGSDPLGYLGMMGRKAWRIWRSGTTASMQTGLGIAVQRGLVALAALALLALAWRRRWEAIVYGTLLLGITAVGAFLLASTRRNETLMPLVIVLASAIMVWSFEWARRRLRRRGEPAT